MSHNTTMLLLVVAAVLCDASEIDRVLSARSSFDVLGISVCADAAEVRSAHRRVMRKVHPDHHCRSPHGAVCETAHRASLLVDNARDALLSEKPKHERSARKPRAARRQQAPWKEPPAFLMRLLAPLCLLALTELLSRAVRRRWQQRQLRQEHMPAARLRALRLARSRAACPRPTVITASRACACAWLLCSAALLRRALTTIADFAWRVFRARRARALRALRRAGVTFWTSDVAYPASCHQLSQHPAQLGCINTFSGLTSRIVCGRVVGSRVGARLSASLYSTDWVGVGESTFGLRNGHLEPQSAQFFRCAG